MAFKTTDKTNEFIRRYLPIDQKLSALISYADKNMIPILLPESAAFLRQLCMLKQPKRVLEIGTGIGYSGHIILHNSPATLCTIEFNEKSKNIAAAFFKESGLYNRVTLLFGDESEAIPMLVGKFDMIFLDGAKTRYLEHLPYLKKLLSPQGVLLADNVLFNKMVTGENKKIGKKQSIVDGLTGFLQSLCADPDFCTSILPVGDGLSLSILK